MRFSERRCANLLLSQLQDGPLRQARDGPELRTSSIWMKLTVSRGITRPLPSCRRKRRRNPHHHISSSNQSSPVTKPPSRPRPAVACCVCADAYVG
jgi:hypothetical protein